MSNKISASINLPWQYPREFNEFIRKHNSRSLRQVLYQLVEATLINKNKEIMDFINHGWYEHFLNFEHLKKPNDWIDKKFNVHVAKEKFPNFYGLYNSFKRNEKSLKTLLVFYFIYLNLNTDNKAVIENNLNNDKAIETDREEDEELLNNVDSIPEGTNFFNNSSGERSFLEEDEFEYDW